MMEPVANALNIVCDDKFDFNESKKLQECYPVLEKYIQEVCKDEIDIQNFFIDKVKNELIPRILDTQPKNSPISILNDYLKLFLELGYYGLKSKKYNCVNLINAILESDKKPIYSRRSKPNLYTELVSNLKDNDNFLGLIYDDISHMSFFNDNSKSLVKIVSFMFAYLDDFDFNVYYELIFAYLQRCLKEESNNINLLIEYLELIKLTASEKESLKLYVLTFVSLIVPFLSSENFQQKFFALKFLDDLFKDLVSRKFICDYFIQNKCYELLKNMTYHSKFSKYIGNILSNILKDKKIDDSFISDYWCKYDFLHETEKDSFFSIFMKIIQVGNIKYVNKVVDTILNETPSIKLFDMIDILIKEVRTRKDKDNFIRKISDFIWSISFDNKIDKDIKERARKSLYNAFSFNKGFDLFKKAEMLLGPDDDTYIVSLLIKFLDSKTRISKDFVQTLIDDVFEKIRINNNPPQILFDYLFSLLKINSEGFDTEQIRKLCDLKPKCNDFLSYINLLVQEQELDDEEINIIISCIPEEEMNMKFYKFVKQLIVDDDNIIIKSLPFQNEELLWKLSLKKIPMNKKFSNLLCKIYASNDGIELNDEKMINEFLNNWETNLNDDNNDIMIDILRYFVHNIESQVDKDYNILKIPHNIYLNQFKNINVNISCFNPKFEIEIMAYPKTKIGCIIDEISRKLNLKFQSIVLYYEGTSLKNKYNLDFCKINNQNVELTAQYIKRSKKTSYHKRTCLPYQLILKREWINDVFEKLKNGNKSVHKLLKELPLLNCAINFSDIFLNFKQTDLQQIFPYDHPYLFYYNFMTLTLKSIQSLEFVNFLYKNFNFGLHLLKMIHLIIQQGIKGILNEIVELFIFFIMHHNTNIFCFYGNDPKILYTLLLKISLQEENNDELLQNIVKFFEKFYSNIPKIEFNQYFSALIGSILMGSKSDNFKLLFVDMIKYIKIPINAFIEILQRKKGGVTKEFFLAINNTLNDGNYYNNTMLLFLFDILKELLYLQSCNGEFLSNLLSLINNISKFCIIDRISTIQLLNFLIDKFLRFEVDARNKICFSKAVETMINYADIKDDDDELILKKSLIILHSNIVPFHDFLSSGDDCEIS